MPYVPDLDSIGFQRLVAEKDGQVSYIPLVYFKDPSDINNYYLFQLLNGTSMTGASFDRWDYSILSDTYIKNYINGLRIDVGSSTSSVDYTTLSEGSPFNLSMSSLTKETYNYYMAIINQFKYDGGAYKPSPSSPPTNINNGALGFFRASAVVKISTIVK